MLRNGGVLSAMHQRVSRCVWAGRRAAVAILTGWLQSASAFRARQRVSHVGQGQRTYTPGAGHGSCASKIAVIFNVPCTCLGR
jgi:hypothetical protein